MGDQQTTALLVVDTDVLIDYLRDQADAVAFLEGCAQPLALSARRQLDRRDASTR